jgi:hypothetical protein
MSEISSDTDWTADELYTLAQEANITGRGDMTKAELREALEAAAPELLRPFQVVPGLEEGDEVAMNHLKSVLTVTETDEADSHYAVIMVTARGGRHALIVPKDGHEVGKNGGSPHLRRWRAGDKEWMNNSTDPLYIRQLEAQEADEAEGDE